MFYLRDKTTTLGTCSCPDRLLLRLPGLKRSQLVNALLLRVDFPLGSGRRLSLGAAADEGFREHALLLVDRSVQIAQSGNGGNHALAERWHLGDVVAVHRQRSERGDAAEDFEQRLVSLESVVGNVDIIQQRALLEVLDRGHIG